MSQLNLLQRAKQGNADAIAALMNQTLRDKAVTAKVVRIQDYLHISFIAANPLNQATLTEFTRQGLARLQVETIQTVKVYGLQQEELPNWISTFQIGLEVIPESPEQTGFWGGNLASLVSSLGDRWSKVLLKATQQLSEVQQVIQTEGVGWKTRLKSVRSLQLIPAPQDILPPGISAMGYVAIASVVTVGAFVAGGTVAGIAISHGESAKPKANSAAPPANRTAPVVEQQEGRQYLNRMVEAQKLFYQKNQQLAQSLEELERSAAVVSHSYNYTYRVTTATPTQFQLAAIARISTLKSYAAVVSLPEPAGAIATKLCETSQPSQVPPIVSRTALNPLQCSEGSVAVP